MSTLESFVWHFLGYAAIPTVFIVGFLVTAVVGCFLLEILGRGEGQ